MNVSTKIFTDFINPASHDFISTSLRHLFNVARERIALAHHSLVNPDQFYLNSSHGEAFLSMTDTSHHYNASTNFGQNGLCSCFQYDSSSQHIWTTTDPACQVWRVGMQSQHCIYAEHWSLHVMRFANFQQGMRRYIALMKIKSLYGLVSSLENLPYQMV